MKTQDTYRSILKGVSQQPPAERLEGQHAEQVNLISDPVHGLVRRNGMVLSTQRHDVITTTALDDALADSYSYRVMPFSIRANPYDLLYRSRPQVGATTDAHLPGLMVYAKFGAGSFLEVVTDVADTALAAYLTGGLSAAVVLGRYLLLAGNTVQPSITLTNRFSAAANEDKAVVYIKTGQYDTKYRIRAKNRSTGITADVTYTTPTAAYGGTLVVDDLNPADPDYQFYLNNRIYAFENATNQWIATASHAVVPSAITTELLALLVAAGMTGWVQDDNYLMNPDIEYVFVGEDGTSGSMVAVHTVVESEQHLTPRHYSGKIVKVQPVKGSEDVYYVEADTGSLAFGEATWRETAGVRQSITSMLAFATVEGSRFFVASSPTILAALVLAETAVVLDPPTFADSSSGDLVTMPPPAFATQPINLLAVFQDRLIVGAGNVLRLSQQGDYLNFYRQSVLTVVATDAAEIFAVGTQGDVIRKAALYDRNMTFYGDSYHYVLPGRTPFDPANPQFSVQYAIEGTGRSQPVQGGDRVFVLKEDSALAACQVLQLNPGVWQDSPQVDNISKQLRSYINGTPAEMVSLSSPSFLFVRTEFINRSEGAYPLGRPFGMYTYNYLDAPDGSRPHEAWSAWEWSAALGTSIGISANPGGDGVLLYTLAFNDVAGGKGRSILVLNASARTEPTGLPYIDGMFPAATPAGLFTAAADYRVQQAVRTVRDASYSTAVPVSDDVSRWAVRPFSAYSVGDSPPQVVDPLRWSGVLGFGDAWLAANPDTLTLDGVFTGFHFEAYVDLTSPVMRNHEDKARLYGHLTLTKLKVSTTKTGGIAGYVAHHSGIDRSLYFDGGYQLANTHSVFVGRESHRVQLRLSSVEWNPMTISSIAWQGDWKNNQTR